MQINQIYDYMKSKQDSDNSGHATDHIDRVVKLAQRIMEKTTESYDEDVVLTAAILHDTVDDKVVKNVDEAESNLHQFLKTQLNEEQVKKVEFIINNMSYSKNLKNKIDLPIEGQIVQDSDRLDAIGNIGIARTFYYGGHKGNLMYDENIQPRENLDKKEYRDENTVINHFYEKLFKLKDLMNTDEAKRIAEVRNQRMIDFVEVFKNEWHGEI